LHAFFVQIYGIMLRFSLAPKIHTKNTRKKRWWNWLLVSISSPVVNFINVLRVHFSYKIFWRQNFVQKFVRKMLMKLTAGINIKEFFQMLSTQTYFVLGLLTHWQLANGHAVLNRVGKYFLKFNTGDPCSFFTQSFGFSVSTRN